MTASLRPMKTTILDEPLLVNPDDRVVILRYGDYLNMEQQLLHARSLSKRSDELLEFIKQKYPNDWKNGVYHWICPFHARLERALEAFIATVKHYDET